MGGIVSPPTNIPTIGINPPNLNVKPAYINSVGPGQNNNQLNPPLVQAAPVVENSDTPVVIERTTMKSQNHSVNSAVKVSVSRGQNGPNANKTPHAVNSDNCTTMPKRPRKTSGPVIPAFGLQPKNSTMEPVSITFLNSRTCALRAHSSRCLSGRPHF